MSQLNVDVMTSHDGQHGNEPTISVAVQRDLEHSASIELRSEEQSVNYIAQVPDIDPFTSFGVQPRFGSALQFCSPIRGM